jgi:hypothetical protein
MDGGHAAWWSGIKIKTGIELITLGTKELMQWKRYLVLWRREVVSAVDGTKCMEGRGDTKHSKELPPVNCTHNINTPGLAFWAWINSMSQSSPKRILLYKLMLDYSRVVINKPLGGTSRRKDYWIQGKLV